MSKSRFALCIATSMAGLSIHGGAWAQAVPQPPTGAPVAVASEHDAGAADSEILVTGSRLRQEAVQDTPVAVSVLSAAQLDALNAADVRALSALVPNLMTNAAAAIPGQALISIRGFNTLSGDVSVEPGIVTYIDGIYQPLTLGNLTDLFDLDRLEVLRGPQGTLLGKNVAAGALLITRSRPTGEFGGKFQAEYGTDNLLELNGLVNFPIVQDKIAGKLFASFRRRDPYVRNLDFPKLDGGRERQFSIRGAILANPTENLEWYLTVDYVLSRPTTPAGRNVSRAGTLNCATPIFCNPDAGRRNVTHTDFLLPDRLRNKSVTSQLDWSIGGVKITSLTGYQDYSRYANLELDGTPLASLRAFDLRNDLDSISQEVRLSSETGGGLDMGGRLTWLVAGYINHSNVKASQGLFSFGRNFMSAQQVIRDSKALFGHLDYDVTDALTASFGVRRSWDEVRHRFASNTLGLTIPAYTNRESAKFRNTSFEGGIQYKIDADKMIYARYAEGYRGGGFVGVPASPAAARGYDPETSRSYEVGIKTEWLDRRLLLNLTIFDTKYSNLQRTSVVAGPNNSYLQTTANAAAATTKGIEAEIVVKPVDNLTLRANGGYLDAKYSRYTSFTTAGVPLDLSNLPFAYAPKYTAGLNVEYRIELPTSAMFFDDVTLRGSTNYLSRHIASNTVTVVAAEQPGYALIDGSISFARADGYSLSFYVRNATNKGYTTFATDLGGVSSIAYDGLGRTWGVTLGARF